MPGDNSFLAQAEKHLHDFFGHPNFRPGQREILQALAAGHDVLVVMPTGGGKSLCYQLPALILPGITLVVSPLISLMKDQVDSLQTAGYPATFINSSLEQNEIFARLEALRAGKYRLVYIAPERFANPHFMEHLRALQVSLFAVDEAHCISQWGHDFRPAYTRLRRARDQLPGVQTLALTATATRRIQDDIIEQLGLREHRKFVAGFDRPNLRFSIDRMHDPMEGVRDYVQKNTGSGIVYAATRRQVEQIAATLHTARIAVSAYHAGMPAEQRKQAQNDFIQERSQVIVATNAFGMGIDKPNVRFVLHFQMPGSIESYYQEAGRAGRDGDPADCILFYSPQDHFLQERFISINNPAVELLCDIYRVLEANRSAEEAPIALGPFEIAVQLDMEESMYAIEGALRVLVHLGYLAKLTGNGNEILLRLEQPAADPSLQMIAEMMPAADGWWPTSYTELAQQLGLKIRELLFKLQDYSRAGTLRVAGPFPQSGLFLLRPADPAHWRQHLRQRETEARKRLEAMVRYCQTGECRRKYILGYFGENYERESCAACDNCTREVTVSEEITVLVQKILSCVVRMQERFGLRTVAEVLKGSKSRKALPFTRLSTYGLLADRPLAEIQDGLRRTLQAGYLESVGTQYPVLKVTPSGWEILRGTREAALPAPETGEQDSAEAPRVDVQLFEELRALRKSLARHRSVPPYAIFPDRTLREMATYYPTTAQALKRISGVGEVKRKTLGPRFMAKIREYMQRHHMEAGQPQQTDRLDLEE